MSYKVVQQLVHVILFVWIALTFGIYMIMLQKRF